MAKMTLKGAEPLIKALQTAENNKAHKAIVKKFGGHLQSTAKRKANFTKGYSTGATRQSMQLDIVDNGFTAVVKTITDYSGYVEKGTRFMEAQPFMKPALEEIEPKFIAELRRAAILE